MLHMSKSCEQYSDITSSKTRSVKVNNTSASSGNTSWMMIACFLNSISVNSMNSRKGVNSENEVFSRTTIGCENQISYCLSQDSGIEVVCMVNTGKTRL